MADKDFTAQNSATSEQLAEQFPCNENPFGIWYDIDGDVLNRWVINDGNGDSIADVASYEVATVIADALRIRHETIDNGLILDAEQKKVIADALSIGLESYGEIERVNNELRIAEQNPDIGRLPYSLQPIFPLSSDYPIGVFTAALRYMRQV